MCHGPGAHRGGLKFPGGRTVRQGVGSDSSSKRLPGDDVALDL